MRKGEIKIGDLVKVASANHDYTSPSMVGTWGLVIDSMPREEAVDFGWGDTDVFCVQRQGDDGPEFWFAPEDLQVLA